MRDVIVHYHLFKNAGSSVDGLLSKSFGDKWMPFDPSNPAGKISANNLVSIIENNPDIDAFSSHCIVPPLPEGDFNVFPIVVLRDPIARVMSAYSFEWKKQLGLEKAKGTLTEYIREKFNRPRANAIEEFQTFRLGVSDKDRTSTAVGETDETVLNQSKKFIASLPAFGLVEDFGTSLLLFQKYLGHNFPQMKFDNEIKNVTQDPSITLHERYENIRKMIGEDTFNELVMRNQLDIKLYSYAQGRFDLMKQSLLSEQEGDSTAEDACEGVFELKASA